MTTKSSNAYHWSVALLCKCTTNFLAPVTPSAVEVPAELAGPILAEVGNLVAAALTAWSNASGAPITAESVMALLPDPTPLDQPGT